MVLIKELGMLKYGNQNRRFAIYECDFCRKHFKALCQSVNNGDKKSCGCMTKKMKARTTHNSSKTRLYKTWQNMKTRCYRKNNKDYKNYGGRGIVICKLWLNNFSEFKAWALRAGYNDTLTIERVDVNLGYSANNCTWIPIQEQNKNKR